MPMLIDGLEVPSPNELYKQADRECRASGLDGPHPRRLRYMELMREHGHIVPKQPGDDGNLPCGWPHRG